MEMLKKLWENKMTKIFMITSVVLIVVIIIISIASTGSTASVSERYLINATKNYLRDNSSMYPLNDYDTKTVTLTTLVNGGYISSKSEGAGCSSYVVVTKLDDDYYYTPFRKCFDGKDASPLSDRLIRGVVTEGPGLYSDNSDYIFRGENPNNYVSLNNLSFRIVGIDENKNIKLIYNDMAYNYKVWDNRYNTTTDKQSGINDYNLSRLKEFLDTYLDTMLDKKTEMFPNEIKVRLTNFDQCVGKINLDASEVDDCSTKIENQMVGTITAIDYIKASLDSTCSVTNVKNCQNYNFLNKSSWTISGYNAYNSSAYYIDKNFGLKVSEAYIARAVFPTIMLKADALYDSGDGTLTDPYIVK